MIRNGTTGDCEFTARRKHDFIRDMNDSAIALLTDRANEQHYEVPAEFFLGVLGERAKYSCCYWNDGVDDLDVAEQLYVECLGYGGNRPAIAARLDHLRERRERRVAGAPSTPTFGSSGE